MPAGRPTLYQEDYCAELIQHMTEGFSFESFAGKIGTCRTTLYVWANTHQEFMYAKKIGSSACLVFWEGLFFKHMENRNFREASYIFNMKARFGWKDQTAIQLETKKADGPDFESMSAPQIEAWLAANKPQKDE